MNEEIDAIVKEFYKVFSKNKPQQLLDACTRCCMTPEDAEKLKSFSVPNIPFYLLKEYQDAAKPASLDLGELKYFAPRYFELISTFQFPSFEPLLSLDRFGYFTDAVWTHEEKVLFDRFMYQFFKKFIKTNRKERIIPAMDFLLLFYKGNFEIKGILELVETLKEPENLVFFSELLDDVKMTHKGYLKVDNSFSDKKFSELICSWVISPGVKKIFKPRIESEILNPSGIFDEVQLTELSRKYEMLV